MQNLQRAERMWPAGVKFLFELRQITDARSFIPESTFPLILARIAYHIFGRTLVTVRMVSLVAYLLTLVVLFFFGKRLTNAWGGLAAACFFACSPYAFNEAHFFSLYALGALMATLTLWLLVKTDHFQSFIWTVLFGIALGWALMTEQAAPIIVLVGPVTVGSIGALIRGRNHSKERLIRALLLLLVAAILALLISGRYLMEYYDFFTTTKYSAIFQPPRGYDETPQPYQGGVPYSPYYLQEGPRTLIGYPVTLFLLLLSTFLLFQTPKGRKTMGALVLLFLLFGWLDLEGWLLGLGGAVILAALLSEPIEYNGLISAWILAPLIIFSLFETKAPQYLFETVPAIALSVSLLSVAAARSHIRKGLVAAAAFLVIAIALSQIVLVSLETLQPHGVRDNNSFMAKMLHNLNWISQPQKGEFRPATEKIAEWIPAGATGLVVYLPGVSSPVTGKETAPTREPDMWFQEFQVWLDYKRPGLDHLLLSRDHLQDLTWPEPKVDYLVWCPMPRHLLELLWEELDMNPEDNVKSYFRHSQSGMNFIQAMPALPGIPLADSELVPGRKAIVGLID